MKSVLPAQLESKRLQIAKVHNRLVCPLAGLLVLGLLVLPFSVSRNHKLSSTNLAVGFLVIGGLEAYGIYRIFQHDKDLCRELGYSAQFATSRFMNRERLRG